MRKFVLVFALASGWAFAADVPGVSNFHQVDDHLYRGAQPTSEGFQNLAKLGIKTVIDLREPGEHLHNEHRPDEQATVTADGMHYINMGMTGTHAPSSSQIAQLLAAIDRESGPIFIHCLRGADRTGTVVASYRIARQNWTNYKALEEAKHDGMSWTEFTMQSFIMHFHPAAVGIPVIPAAQAAPVASSNNSLHSRHWQQVSGWMIASFYKQ